MQPVAHRRLPGVTASWMRKSRLRCSTLLCGLCAALAWADNTLIHLRNADVATQANSPAAFEQALNALRPAAGGRHAIIQFNAIPDAAQRTALEFAGVTLLSALGADAYVVRLDAPFDHAAAAAIAPLGRDVLPLYPEWKLQRDLLAGRVPEWALTNAAEVVSAAAEPTIAVYVALHGDVDLPAAARDLIPLYQGVVMDKLSSVNALVVELPLGLIEGLAQEDRVQWIEPALPQLSELNDSSRTLIQADGVQADLGLTGTGVTAMIYDGGTARATHVDFEGRLNVIDSAGRSTHPTHVAGTVGGAGVASGGLRRGMAPDVQLLSYGLQTSGGGTFLYTNPGDLEADYRDAINRGADISNNSIGTNVEPNGFACELQGDYGVTDALIDAIVRGSLGAPYRVIWAAGNERSGSRCDVEGFGDYYSSAPPAGAKNHVCVGAVNSNNDSMTGFSSWGPTDDGRMKPDVVGPGCQSGDDNGVTSCSNSTSDNGYAALCGTSMACPAVTGVCALMLQDFRTRFAGQPDPRNSTLKVLLTHTAIDLGNPGPDYVFGYGSVRARAAIDFMRSGNFVESQVEAGGVYVAFTSVPFASPAPLKVTLAWDDPPATPLAASALVNDLDLVLIGPDGVERFAWTLDPENPGNNAVRSGPNRRDNIEQVVVDSPPAGTWRIEVRGFNVPQGPQILSLAASPNFVGLQMSVLTAVPSQITPNTPQPVDVRIRAINQALVAGSLQLRFRYDATRPLTSVALAPLGGDVYRGTLPGAICGATPEFFFSARGVATGEAVTNTTTQTVGEVSTVFSDNFETDRGWTVVNGPGLTDGAWTRGVPVGGGDRGDPATDFDGSGQCFLTDNTDGNSDVDGGSTFLISPRIDLSTGDAEVISAIWYTNNTGDDPNQDIFTIYVSSNDGANWTTARVIGPQTSPGWNEYTFRVGQFVPPTATVRLRFEASDPLPGAVVEAGVDAVRLVRRGCAATLADCNSNRIADVSEIALGLAVDADGDLVPDECEAEVGSTIVESAGETSVTEAGATDSYSLRLTAAPTADVVVTVGFPAAQILASPAALTFTSTNWNVPQTVTISAVDDEVFEAGTSVSVTHTAASSDPRYSGLALPSVTVTVLDDDPQFAVGDVNCSGAIDFDDIPAFVTALTSRASYVAAFPACDVDLADINRDGLVNFADIDPFVQVLVTGG